MLITDILFNKKIKHFEIFPILDLSGSITNTIKVIISYEVKSKYKNKEIERLVELELLPPPNLKDIFISFYNFKNTPYTEWLEDRIIEENKIIEKEMYEEIKKSLKLFE